MKKEKVIELYRCIDIQEIKTDEDGNPFSNAIADSATLEKELKAKRSFFKSPEMAVKSYIGENLDKLKPYIDNDGSCMALCAVYPILESEYRAHRIKPILKLGSSTDSLVVFDNEYDIDFSKVCLKWYDILPKIFSWENAMRIFKNMHHK